jgi:hypothetical protein
MLIGWIAIGPRRLSADALVPKARGGNAAGLSADAQASQERNAIGQPQQKQRICSNVTETSVAWLNQIGTEASLDDVLGFPASPQGGSAKGTYSLYLTADLVM